MALIAMDDEHRSDLRFEIELRIGHCNKLIQPATEREAQPNKKSKLFDRVVKELAFY